jgi:hypothetical protein
MHPPRNLDYAGGTPQASLILFSPPDRCVRILCQNCVRYPRKPQSNSVIYGDTPIRIVVAVLFVSIWVVLAASITAVWLTAEVRVIGLVMLPTGIVAGLLVVYFDWRAKLLRRVLAERDVYRKAA